MPTLVEHRQVETSFGDVHEVPVNCLNKCLLLMSVIQYFDRWAYSFDVNYISFTVCVLVFTCSKFVWAARCVRLVLEVD